MQSKPTVSFVIVNYNGGDLLGACLRSLRDQTLGDHDVLVVDNGSSDGSEAAALGGDERVRLLRLGANLGFAEGSNRGIRASAGRYVALVNNDVVLAPQWAERLVAALEAAPECGAAAGRVLQQAAPERLDCAGFEFYGCVSSFDYRGWPADAFADGEHRPFGPVAAAAMYRRSALEHVGLFHPEYFCYYEDTDLAVRLVLFGYDTAYVDEAVAWHVGSATGSRSSEFHVYHLRRNAEYLYWVDMVGSLALTELPLHALHELAAAGLALTRGQGRIVARAKLDALRNAGFVWRARRHLRGALARAGSTAAARRRLTDRMKRGLPWLRRMSARADGTTTAYLVVHENLTLPLIESQVIDVLSCLADEQGRPVTLIWLYRLDARVRGLFRLGALREQLRARGIDLVAVPSPAFLPHLRWFGTVVMAPYWTARVLLLQHHLGFGVLHSRSYPAGLVGACVARLGAARLVFDPRSPLPEEHLAAGTWGVWSPSFVFWKRVERWVMAQASVTIATSQSFADSLPLRGATVVPNNYPRDDRAPPVPPAKPEFLFVYAGSARGWNRLQPYAEFCRRYAARTGGGVALRVLVTAADRALAETQLAGLGPPCSVAIDSVPQHAVARELARSRVGLYLMERVDPRLGVKLVEYLAAGLPVVVSDTVQGAAEQVARHGVGVVLRRDHANLDEVVELVRRVVAAPDEWRARCRAVAEREFSPRRVASDLARIYAAVRAGPARC